MKKELNRYRAIAEGLCLLFSPHIEVVIHDLKTGKIAGIYHNFSKRKVGDESLLEGVEMTGKFPDVFAPYFKINWDGRRIRSTSATIRDKKGNPIGLFCMNLDVSKWEEMQHFISGLLQPLQQERPETLFKDDWREKINTYVTAFLKQEGESLEFLSKEKKRQLVHALYREGAFEAKHAASYIGKVLKLSRATIYNYLGKK